MTQLSHMCVMTVCMLHSVEGLWTDGFLMQLPIRADMMVVHTFSAAVCPDHFAVLWSEVFCLALDSISQGLLQPRACQIYSLV